MFVVAEIAFCKYWLLRGFEQLGGYLCRIEDASVVYHCGEFGWLFCIRSVAHVAAPLPGGLPIVNYLALVLVEDGEIGALIALAHALLQLWEPIIADIAGVIDVGDGVGVDTDGRLLLPDPQQVIQNLVVSEPAVGGGFRNFIAQHLLRLLLDAGGEPQQKGTQLAARRPLAPERQRTIIFLGSLVGGAGLLEEACGEFVMFAVGGGEDRVAIG